MAYSPHIKIVAGGAVYNDTSAGTEIEEWSCSLSAIRAGGGEGLPAGLGTCTTQWQNLFSDTAVKIHPTVGLGYVKVNEINSLGHQITDPTNANYFTTPPRGAGGASPKTPLQIALRVSLDDGTRNRRARGGFYLPRMSNEVNYAGVYSDADMLAVASRVKTMLDAINNLTGWTVAVASKVDASLTPVLRVRVGNVPDVIRRRRNDLLESRQTVMLAP